MITITKNDYGRFICDAKDIAFFSANLYEFDEINTDYPTYMNDIKEEAKDSAAEMLRLSVIPVDFEFKAADIICEWVVKYIKINEKKKKK